MMAGEQMAAMLITVFVAVVTIAGTLWPPTPLGCSSRHRDGLRVTLQNVLTFVVVRVRLDLGVSGLLLRACGRPDYLLASTRLRGR
jgi:hypothetical protein